MDEQGNVLGAWIDGLTKALSPFFRATAREFVKSTGLDRHGVNLDKALPKGGSQEPEDEPFVAQIDWRQWIDHESEAELSEYLNDSGQESDDEDIYDDSEEDV